MSAGRVQLSVGSRFRCDGDVVTVTGLRGDMVQMRDHLGRAFALSVLELVAAGEATPAEADGQEVVEGVGAVLAELTDAERHKLDERVAHVQEALTGFACGQAELARPGEPRPEFDPSVSLNDRVRSKAAELGVDERTVFRWRAALLEHGPAGLLDRRLTRASAPLGGLDQRWVDALRAVLDESVSESTLSAQLLLDRAEARVIAQYGPGVVRVPKRTRAHEVVSLLGRGRNATRGSAKGRRSIASRPSGTFGRLRATRPGEFVLIDTTVLDVYAMESVTNRWVKVELTVALDLHTRCVVGLRLSPISTRSIDLAAVLFDVLVPRAAPAHWPAHARWPYHGIPAHLVLGSEGASGADGAQSGLAGPTVVPETVVVDHGRIYQSAHFASVCARLGISVQPARAYTGSDKGPVERLFRTIRGLLEALPGYKGPDVYSRGARVEDDAFFFIHELEAILRQWLAEVYHLRPHAGLVVPECPGLELSPARMYDEGVARAGVLYLPANRGLAYDVLPVVWRAITHYGVNVNTLVYNGPALDGHRHAPSPHAARQGRWPFRYHPDDLRFLYFQDPETLEWHQLTWVFAESVGGPFGTDALAYAKRLAGAHGVDYDHRGAFLKLLAGVGVDLAAGPAERRVALRRARDNAALLPSGADEPAVAELSSVRAVLDPTGEPVPGEGEAGDDDVEDEVSDLDPVGADGQGDVDDAQFYGPALPRFE